MRCSQHSHDACYACAVRYFIGVCFEIYGSCSYSWYFIVARKIWHPSCKGLIAASRHQIQPPPLDRVNFSLCCKGCTLPGEMFENTSLTDKINLISIPIGALSSIFFIVGISAFSKEKRTVEMTSWMWLKEGIFEAQFGLRRIFASVADEEVTVEYDGVCAAAWCDVCAQNGKGAVGLVFLALLFAVATIIWSGKLWKVYTNAGQILNVFLSFTSACTALTGVGLFMGDCFYKMRSDASAPIPLSELEWGPGSKVTILGMFLMWIVSFLQIIACARDEGYVQHTTLIKHPVAPCTVLKDA